MQSELEALRAQLSELQGEKQMLEQQNALLKQRIRDLERCIFARRSEKYIDHPELPFPGDEPEPEPPPYVDEAPDDEERNTDPKGRKRRRRGVSRVAAELPRVREVVEPGANEAHCPEGCERQVIGEEVTEKLEYNPASFYIREIVRPKYACRAHEEHGVATSALPAMPIPKGMAGPSLLAQVCTAKYKDHLPLHRQHGIYLRHGVDIAESTMVDWVRECAALLAPVVAATKVALLSRDIVHTDDTPICVLEPGKRRSQGSRRGFLWAYLGDPGEVVFDFTEGRSRDGPRAFFGDYEGYVQADAFPGYNILFVPGSGRIEVGCWAHSRRRYCKALDTEPDHAKPAIAAIRGLYQVEALADEQGMDPGARLQLRLQQSKPALESFRKWLEEVRKLVLPKSPMGKAIDYTLRQWGPLTAFLQDGRLKLDNNRCERAIRQVAVGRKNWMFAGSAAGAERAATIYSVIGGCIELRVDAPATRASGRLTSSSSPHQPG